MEEYIGIIKMFAGNFAPRQWAFCNGQLLAIAQNQALFSILGTTYGGDGRTSFALPDLRGRTAIHAGHGPGLQTTRVIGQKTGIETTVLTTSNLPSHNHSGIVNRITASAEATISIPAVAESGNASEPGSGVVFALGEDATSGNEINSFSSSPSDTNLKPFEAPVAINATAGEVTIGLTGNNTPFNNMQPSACVNYIICMQGLFPPRS